MAPRPQRGYARTSAQGQMTTAGGKTGRAGPERFWRRRAIDARFLGSLVISGLLHASAFPLEWPSRLEVKDIEGKAEIAVDLLRGSGAAEQPDQQATGQPAVEPAAHERPNSTGVATRLLDAGSNRRDAEASDASADARGDAHTEGGSPLLATDAGLEAGTPDTQMIVGAAGAIQAEPVLVAVLINAEVIRQNPVGATLGALLRGIPQWNDFMTGTDIDPVRDTDWVMISGSSLVNTARDIVLIRYGTKDSVIDRAIVHVSRRSPGGGAYDAGVPGVKATLAFADRAERVLLRPAPHVLAVVPPSVASKEARQLSALRLPAHVLPGQAVYFRFDRPHRAVPDIPESITELRLRVIPNADRGADVYVEGDTQDAQAAALAAPEITQVIRRHTGGFVTLFTHGLFDRVDVRSDGQRVLVHLSVTLDDLVTLAAAAGLYLGVPLPELPSAGTSAPSSPTSPAGQGPPGVAPATGGRRQ